MAAPSTFRKVEVGPREGVGEVAGPTYPRPNVPQRYPRPRPTLQRVARPGRPRARPPTGAKPALMCKTAKDFFHAVKWAVANQDEARAIAAEARELVFKERTIQANAWRWHAALDGD